MGLGGSPGHIQCCVAQGGPRASLSPSLSVTRPALLGGPRPPSGGEEATLREPGLSGRDRARPGPPNAPPGPLLLQPADRSGRPPRAPVGSRCEEAGGPSLSAARHTHVPLRPHQPPEAGAVPGEATNSGAGTAPHTPRDTPTSDPAIPAETPTTSLGLRPTGTHGDLPAAWRGTPPPRAPRQGAGSQGDSHPSPAHGGESAAEGSRSPGSQGRRWAGARPSVPLCPAVPSPQAQAQAQAASPARFRPRTKTRAGPATPVNTTQRCTAGARRDPREHVGGWRRSPGLGSVSLLRPQAPRPAWPPGQGPAGGQAVTRGPCFCPSGTRSWRSGTWTSSSAGLRRGHSGHCPQGLSSVPQQGPPRTLRLQAAGPAEARTVLGNTCAAWAHCPDPLLLTHQLTN